MNIGLSSASFYPTINTEESIKIMKSIGFDIGEIFLNTESEYEKKFINILLKEKKKYKFNINSIHCYSSMFEPYLFDKYERRRKDVIKTFKKACKAAKLLEAKCYTFHGPRYMGQNIDIDHVLNIYRELVYIAMENNIYLCQENVSWCQSSDINFIRLLKSEIKELRYTLDLKQAFKANVEPIDYIDIMGKDLKNFHINDKNENESCLLPTKGNIDYKKIFMKLKDIKYEGNAIIEVYRENFNSYGELRESKENLEKIYKNI